MFKRQESLFAPVESRPGWGHFGMCPMLQNLLLIRSDVSKTFDVSTDVGLADAIAWMFVRALPELDLDDALDATTLRALNAPVSYYPDDLARTGEETSDRDDIVELSVLMALVWRHRKDVQHMVDLSIPLGRAKFLVWFATHGVSEMGLQRLISASWRQWLTNVPHQYPSWDVPRLGLLCWIVRDDLRRAFDIESDLGRSHLLAWTNNALATEQGWRWLRTVEPDLGTVEFNKRRRWALPTKKERGVNLVGFARGELGIGEDVRMAALACEAAGVQYSVVNISTGQGTRQADSTLLAAVVNDSKAPYPINIFCLTAFDTAQCYLVQGAGLFRRRYNIGWWPWELPVWPNKWKTAFGLVDEVWAATQFTHAMYRLVSSVPTALMPLPAEVNAVTPIKRSRFRLPARRFLFLYVFDFNSYLTRKNPQAAIQAFSSAFAHSDDSVGLVLKTMYSKSDDPLWKDFKAQCARDKRIILIEETLDRGDVLGLIQVCDAYVSLHRSEGFGRTLAEAMLFGKPVVGTNFSGNVDFMNEQTGFPVKWRRKRVADGEYPFVEPTDEAWWADPDIGDAARQMRAARLAAKDPMFGERVKRFAKVHFSPARIGALMKDRLSLIDV